MNDVLYQWPVGAAYGGRVPKEKLYQNARVNAVLRQMFVADVERITWTHKLAEETVNLPSTPAVAEIEVFRIDSRRSDVVDMLLAVIDKAIPNPIIFEITRGPEERREIRMVAAHKTLAASSSKAQSYYSTRWMPADTARAPLPTAISLPALYAALLFPLTPIDARPGEDVLEVGARLETVRRLQRELLALERKIRSEPQLNRRIDLRRSLRAKQAELREHK